MRRILAELTGTFCLVFVATAVVVVDTQTAGVVGHVGIALATGLIVMVMIYTIGELSGAHINPAVTLGFWLAGRFSTQQVIPYILAQVGGAILASLLVLALFRPVSDLGRTLPAGSWQQSLILEVVLTAILMLVILRVSRGSKETGIMAGAAIGSVVALAVLFAGPVSGASMNPARSLAPAVVGLDTSFLWIYLVAPPVGAALAVVLDQCLGSPLDPASRVDGKEPEIR